MEVDKLIFACSERVFSVSDDEEDDNVIYRYLSNIRDMCVNAEERACINDVIINKKFGSESCIISELCQMICKVQTNDNDLRDFYTMSNAFDITKIEAVVSSMCPKDYLDKCIICYCICFHVSRCYKDEKCMEYMALYQQNYIDGWEFDRAVFGMCGVAFNYLCLNNDLYDFGIFGDSCIDMYVSVMSQIMHNCAGNK